MYESLWYEYGGLDLPTATEFAAAQQQERIYPQGLEQVRRPVVWSLPPSPVTPNGETFALIKKSIRQIKAEAVSEEAQTRIGAKITRLRTLGVEKQAQILELELKVRVKLQRVQEWNYKVLPYDAIQHYNHKIINSYTMIVHIDLLEQYCGTVAQDESKDRIMPEEVLDELEKAKDRQIFDQFHVLWVEKVKDPLLLASIEGCKDFFLIAEWSDDISFEQIMNGYKA